MVVCLEQGANLHMVQLMPLPLTVSCFSKIQIGFTFLVPAHLVNPGKRAVKRVCVCVCVCKWLQVTAVTICQVITPKSHDFPHQEPLRWNLLRWARVTCTKWNSFTVFLRLWAATDHMSYKFHTSLHKKCIQVERSFIMHWYVFLSHVWLLGFDRGYNNC